MKYIVLISTILFLSGCSPKYKVIKEYHPPKVTNSADASICLGLCESQRQACQSQCEAAFSSCKVKAHRIANQRYAAKIQQYTNRLEQYVDEMNMYDIDMRLYPIGYYGYPFYGPRLGYGYGYANSLFWYDPIPYRPYLPKPKKPSLAQEKLKAETEFCDLDCGCSQKFDSCYRACGGKIVSKKLCIENCPNGN